MNVLPIPLLKRSPRFRWLPFPGVPIFPCCCCSFSLRIFSFFDPLPLSLQFSIFEFFFPNPNFLFAEVSSWSTSFSKTLSTVLPPSQPSLWSTHLPRFPLFFLFSNVAPDDFSLLHFESPPYTFLTARWSYFSTRRVISSGQLRFAVFRMSLKNPPWLDSPSFYYIDGCRCCTTTIKTFLSSLNALEVYSVFLPLPFHQMLP